MLEKEKSHLSARILGALCVCARASGKSMGKDGVSGDVRGERRTSELQKALYRVTLGA